MPLSNLDQEVLHHARRVQQDAEPQAIWPLLGLVLIVNVCLVLLVWLSTPKGRAALDWIDGL